MADLPHPFTCDTRDRVGAIVYDKEGRLLIVKGMSKYSLPKGCRCMGETEWDGACRELYEETGLDIEELLTKKSAIFLCQKKLRWGTYMVFRLMVPATQVLLHPQEEEVTELHWKGLHSKWDYKTLNSDLRDLVLSSKLPRRFVKR